MQRDLSITVGVIGFIVVVAVLVFANGSKNGLSLSDTNAIPTSFILGATATTIPEETVLPTVSVSTTPPLIKSPTPTITPSVSITPTTTQTAAPRFTCNKKTHDAKLKATEFMNKHKAKEPYAVLGLISEPLNDQDQESYDFWLETDGSTVPRLYSSTSTIYTTVSYRFTGELEPKGNDPDIRGTTKCQLIVLEMRKTETPGESSSFYQKDYTRYINFSMAEDGTLILTGFAENSQGQKYTGFN